MISGDPTTVDDLHCDVLIQILSKLDGPTLATASCTTSHLRLLATDPRLWEHLCLSTWPSLSNPRLLDLIPSFSTSNHRNFFSQIYPFPVLPIGNNNIPICDRYFGNSIISAVDIYQKDEVIFSIVIETDTRSQWFLSSPFRIDAFDRRNRTPSTTCRILSPEVLTLSWIIIDPTTHHAVNLSSRRPVSVDRHWYTGEIQVRFAVILGEHVGSIVVTCGGEEMHLLEVTMTVDDDGGLCLNGEDSLVVLRGGILGWERKGNWKKEEGGLKAKERYWEYKRKKKVRRECTVDLFLVLAGVFFFYGFLVRMAYR